MYINFVSFNLAIIACQFQFWGLFPGIFYIDTHIICKTKTGHLFLSNLCAFYFFFLFYYTSSIMLNRSGGRGHLCFAPSLRTEACSFSPLSIMLGVVFLQMFFIKWRKFFFIPSFLKIFKIINGCWILSNALSTPIDIII